MSMEIRAVLLKLFGNNVVMSFLICLITWTALCYSLVTLKREAQGSYSISYPPSVAEEINGIIRGNNWFNSVAGRYQRYLLRFANLDFTILGWPSRARGTFRRCSYVSDGEHIVELDETPEEHSKITERKSVVISDPNEESEIIRNVAQRFVCEFICGLFAATFFKVNQHPKHIMRFNTNSVPHSRIELDDDIKPLIKDRGNSEEELEQLLKENNKLSEHCLGPFASPQRNLSTFDHAKQVADELSEAWDLLNREDKKFIDDRL